MERLLSHDVPIGKTQVSLAQLNERSRDIFRQIVESYLATGEPVGSRNISRLIATPLSPAAGVVLTAKSNVRLKHIEFVRLEPERALVILVGEDGQVENRIITVPAGLPAASLTEAANFLNARVRGFTLAGAKVELEKALAAAQAELDQLTQKIVAAGLASWSGGESDERKLIVRGAAHLLEDLKAVEDLERVRL